MPKYILDEEDILRKKDFHSSFEKVIELVLKIQKQQSESIAKLESTYSFLLNKLQTDHGVNLSDLKKQTSEFFDGKILTANNKLTSAEMKIDRMSKEHLAKTAATDRAIAEAKIEIKNLKDKDINELRGRLDSADHLVQKVNSASELIKPDKVEGLSELQKKVDLATKMESRRVIAGPSANMINFSDLTSQCDGSTKTFNTPKYRVALMLVGTQFPIIYRNVTDFTTGNGKITLTAEVSAPAANQSLILLYIK